MKYLILLLTLLITSQANAITIDPTIPGQTTLTITCTYPIAREDGTLLTIGEIAKVNFFVKKSGGDGGFIPAGENTTACKQIYDMTLVADGTYIYEVATVDTDGRESVLSNEMFTAIVKRLPNPNTPTGVTGLVS